MANEVTQQTQSDEYTPRLSVDISEEQHKLLRDLIPHGLKGQIFRLIVQDLIDLLQISTQREAILALILNRTINVPCRSLEIETDGSKSNPT